VQERARWQGSRFDDEGRMTAGDSPSLARRRVRLALRDAREQAELTQQQVAEASDFSLSKVIRIESGEVTIAPNDLRALLPLLKVSDPAQIAILVADAKLARSRPRGQWWTEARFKGHVTEPLRRLIEFERSAVAMRLFGNYLIPGPLQTSAFADAVLRRWKVSLAPEDVAIRLDARMRRRKAFLERTDTPQVRVLLDESAVRRLNGSAEILADQLLDTIRLAETGRITLRVIPFDSVDAPLPTIGTFDLLYLDDKHSDDQAVVYFERDVEDGLSEDPAATAHHREVFDKLWVSSLDEGATIAFFQRRLARLGAG